MYTYLISFYISVKNQHHDSVLVYLGLSKDGNMGCTTKPFIKIAIWTHNLLKNLDFGVSCLQIDPDTEDSACFFTWTANMWWNIAMT